MNTFFTRRLARVFQTSVAAGAVGLAGFGIFGAAQAQAQPQAIQNAPNDICMTVPGMEDLSQEACAHPNGTGAPDAPICMTVPGMEDLSREACAQGGYGPVQGGDSRSDLPRGGQSSQGGPNGHRVPDPRSTYPGYPANSPPPPDFT